MDKESRSLGHLLITAIFIGILLSFSIFYLVQTAMGRETDVTDTCLDGSVIGGEDFLNRFNRSVYQNADMLAMIREHQFLALNAVSGENVIVGDDDFLFEIRDTEYEYSYLDDYLGLEAFTEEEHAAILSLLQRRTESYRERGAQYLLVVLPNAQTVYSENMPAYLGNIAPTRLARLEEYLAANGFENLLDLTDALIEAKSSGTLYNNTENSLNSLGIYHVYVEVCEYFSEGIMSSVRVIPRGDLSFYNHLTTGKAVARRAGISDVALNLTVSLGNNAPHHYLTPYRTGRLTQTKLHDGDLPLGMADTPSLLLQFSDKWDRMQAEPFFSNSFKKVTYQTDWIDDAESFQLASPSVVVQFIHENQLSWLLPRNTHS